MNKVADHLYLGGAVAANEHKSLSKEGVSSIVRLCPLPADYNPPESLTKHAFEFEDSASEDISKIIAAFESCHAVIESGRTNNSPVLVHCKLGISRSPAAVVYHLMKSKKITFDEAYTEVTRARPVVNINDFFVNILKKVETDLISKA
eukprot:Colp12_sorted_trinity150504_noHs@20956